MQNFQYTKQQNIRETVAEFLTRKFLYRNYEGWSEQIEKQRILLNGKPTRPDTVLRGREIISYITLREEEPPVDTSYCLLYEDNRLLGVSKSGNIPVTRSGRYVFNNLLNVLKEELKLAELYAVQRLDRETSGVLVFAKDSASAAKMGEIISGYVHKKCYHTVLKGQPTQDKKFVDAAMAKPNINNSTRIRQEITPNGKPAQTEFRFLHSDGHLTLAEVETFTGRTHQIRCHADYIGMPIIGDKLYGQNDADFLALTMGEKVYETPYSGTVTRQLLHATAINFPHPYEDKTVELYADWRPYFSVFPKIKEFLDRAPL